MKISELVKKIEKDYPINSCYDFDNSGANIVDVDEIIKGIVICLDVTLKVIEHATKNGCNLIISHHPLTFHSYKNINSDIQAKRIRGIIRNDLNCYSCHTNFDVNLTSGMGKIFVERLFKTTEIKKQELLETNVIDKKKYGIGNVITLKKSISYDDLVKKICFKFDIDEKKMSIYPIDEKKLIKTIAILPGSGASDLEKVIDKKVDAYITSDLKHNDILDLLETGISYIGATHYGMEKIFIEYMQKYIKNKAKTKVLTYYDYKI